jgi:hypothetical protein
LYRHFPQRRDLVVAILLINLSNSAAPFSARTLALNETLAFTKHTDPRLMPSDADARQRVWTRRITC